MQLRKICSAISDGINSLRFEIAEIRSVAKTFILLPLWVDHR